MKDGYVITSNKAKEQAKAEVTIAILKCKCYSLNFLVSFLVQCFYITFCPNLACCQRCFMVVQLLQSRMPICIPGVSFDYFYLHSSKTSPDLSFHLAMSRVSAVSSFQNLPDLDKKEKYFHVAAAVPC